MHSSERPALRINGFLMLFVILPAIAVLILYALSNVITMESGFGGEEFAEPNEGAILLVIMGGIIGLISLFGFTVLQPNESQVLIFFGTYVGTIRTPGFHWVNPFAKPQSKRVSLRMHNFDSAKVKVNDRNGNPVEIAAVVVWRVIDTATAVFDVQNYNEFVRVQSETAVRHLATSYPYDTDVEGALSLSGTVDQVSQALQDELSDRLTQAGVQVIEARLSHLAYAPEIAAAMLRRQQAAAVVSARKQMVEGAVGMVDLALQRLSSDGIVELDPDRKAQLVSNLLVVLTSEQGASPIVNASA